MVYYVVTRCSDGTYLLNRIYENPDGRERDIAVFNPPKEAKTLDEIREIVIERCRRYDPVRFANITTADLGIVPANFE